MTNLNQDQIDLWSAETILEGRKLRLQPLTLKHLDDLEKNLLLPNAWHSVHWNLSTRSDIENRITTWQIAQKNKMANSFVMILKSSGEAVGQSGFMNFNRKAMGLEIGSTWVSGHWQKSFVNTEAKLLMLTYAFENIKCQRVEFRVDSLNFNSQKAVLRLGAKFEGLLRNSCLLPDGRKRDYHLFSIIDSEWANIKKILKWYLDKYV